MRVHPPHLFQSVFLGLLGNLAVFAGILETSPPTSALPSPTVAPGTSLSRHPLPEMVKGEPDLRPRRPISQATNTVAGEVLVKLRKGSRAAQALQQATGAARAALAGITDMGELGPVLAKHGVSSFRPVFGRASRESGGPQRLRASVPDEKRETLFRWCRLSLPPNADSQAVLEELSRLEAVECAEPVLEWHIVAEIPPIITGLPDGTTDPDFGQQWHHSMVRDQAAWNYLKNSGRAPGGARDVVVAVIDTGVDSNHPDLVGNLWNNPGEIAGNGLDDDGNGFVDDVHGCSVVSDPRSHSGESQDLNGHGTHVAGIIAATAFNHQGGVGVAFNVQLMAVRATQSSGVITVPDAAEGILYAVDNGAEVINMSFGGYQYSQIIADALDLALNQAVLVAAAGNDSLDGRKFPFYPAALPIVHGVMAVTPDNLLAWFSNYSYDTAAPGESIYSTLPGSEYAAWSGTSMAAPVISGIAALLRSFYWQRDIYSARFLMGAIFAAGHNDLGGVQVIDAYRAVSELPKPGVTLLQRWLFDDQTISPRNDADGRPDSGETIHLAVELINRSGEAENVVATLRARPAGAVLDDPYVTFVTNTVHYGNIGPFNIVDNGMIRDASGLIMGVARPFVVQVSSNCPNDHVIAFELTTSFLDGWNPREPGPYTNISRFECIVQRGREVPRVIPTGSTFTLDQSEYWIVGGPVLVEPGATLQITEGAQVQWGGVSSDPYNPGPQTGSLVVRGKFTVQGTATNPVSLFPSYLVGGQTTAIMIDGSGTGDLQYVKIRNPRLTGFRRIDHGYVDWDALPSRVDFAWASNTIFHKLRGGGEMTMARTERCLFDAGWLNLPSAAPTVVRWNQSMPAWESVRTDCVFLQDNENVRPLTLVASLSFKNPLTCDNNDVPLWVAPLFTNGVTYVVLPMERTSLRLAESIASYFGGHVTSVRDQAESDLLRAYLPGTAVFQAFMHHAYFYLGLTDQDRPGSYTWLDGSPVTFTDWAGGYPIELSPASQHLVQILDSYNQPQTLVWNWRNVQQLNSQRYGNGGPGHWDAFVLRLPGEHTIEELNAALTSPIMLSHVREAFVPYWQHNAFLSPCWDPAISHWMRIVGTPNTSNGYCTLRNNYWGTDNTNLVNHMILDYYDDFTSARVDYGDAPANGFASTYPFVEGVVINGQRAETVPQLSAGRTDFTVTFNRDMDTNTEPFVSFGPSPPYTDFSISPRDADFHFKTNGWVDVRTWHGAAWITPVTGEGYHLMRVSGAVAADDPWLVSGYDVGRFRFEVRTMAVTAMTMQASGREGAVALSWQQNDYTLLAGYNLYRADTPTGPWGRLNETVIPRGHEFYLDTSVPPAVLKFYKFTVLSTDFTESDPSPVVAAAALDTVPPVLDHTPITQASPGRGLRVAAIVTDNSRVESVLVFHRPVGTLTAYASLAAANISGETWSVTIPGSAVEPPGVEYYLVASDGRSRTYSGTSTLPYRVTVQNVPTLISVTPDRGSAAGGTAVTLAGAMFDAGARVFFGDALAENATLISPNQLMCVTPAHFPAQVDVTLVNTNGTRSTLLNAFGFEENGSVVSLPRDFGESGSQVELAVTGANVTGLGAVEIEFTFNPAVLSARTARVGTLTAGWSLSANLDTPGRVTLSMANASTVTGSGSLAVIVFQVSGAPTASTPLGFQRISLNDGALVVTSNDGLFTVNGFHRLSGQVNYFGSGLPVAAADLTLAGSGTFTVSSDQEGSFAFPKVPTGSYRLTPTKTNEITEITAYDAALVLAASAGLLTLSPEQFLAADVNRNGAVSAMDAFYILQKAVGLIEGQFPGAGRIWDFAPEERSYSLLNSDQGAQDFTAVLVGDVSGNWKPRSAPGAALASGPPDDPSGQAVVSLDHGPPIAGSDQCARVMLKSRSLPVRGVDLVLRYTPTNQAVVEVVSANAANAALLAANTNQSGTITVAVASAAALVCDGPLFTVRFAGSEPVNCQIESTRVNESQVRVRLEANPTSFDADEDGLIDADETEFFHTNPEAADTDRDRMPDGAEVRAGTNPNDPASRLALFTATPAPGGRCTITWGSVPGKSYQVESKDDLAAPSWRPCGTVLKATGAATSVTDETAPAGPRRLYRVRLSE